MAMNRSWPLLVGGIGLGGGLMYLLDPDRGRRRRALLRDQAVHAAHAIEECCDTTFRDARNRARGIAAETRSRFNRDGVSDEVLVERVRAAMGHVCSHPHPIQVSAEGGRVSLTGPVLEEEVKGLLSAISRVHGVKSVENGLEVHREPGDVPGLQGGSHRPRRYRQARANWDPATRLMLGAAGGALSAYGATRKDLPGAVLGLAGLAVLGRAATNMPMDRLTGMGAGRCAIDLRRTINIEASPEEVFAYCMLWENYPRFMSHVREVSGDGQRSHWVVDGPGGIPVSWEAKVTEFIPNELLAWESVEGSTIRQSGKLCFQQNEKGGTRLDIRISYNPPAGAIGHAFSSLFGADPERQLAEDFLRLKSLIEDGKTSAPHKGEVSRAEFAAV